MPDPTTTDQLWSQAYDNGRDYTLITSQVLSKVLSFIEEDTPKSCLDIGCGTGQLTRELYHRGYACVGIDASSSAIKIAQTLTVLPPEQLLYQHFDIEHEDVVTLERRQHGLITCKLVYAFITDKPAFLQKVKQLLAPNGVFVVITPHVDDTPAERRTIAVGEDELKLLSSQFEQLALYKGEERGGALTYFIGR